MSSEEKSYKPCTPTELEEAKTTAKHAIRRININIIFWAVYAIVFPLGFLPFESFFNKIDGHQPIICALLEWALMFVILPFLWLYISICIANSCHTFDIKDSLKDDHREVIPGNFFTSLLRVACLPLYTFVTIVLLHHDVSIFIIYAFSAVIFLVVLIFDLILKKWSKKVLDALTGAGIFKSVRWTVEKYS